MMRNRQNISRELNKERNERMRDKSLEKLQASLQELQGFAQELHNKNEKLTPAAMLPFQLNAQNIQSKPIRDLALVKYIQLAEQTLKEFSEISPRAFGEFHFKKIIDQEKSIRNLLGLLRT